MGKALLYRGGIHRSGGVILQHVLNNQEMKEGLDSCNLAGYRGRGIPTPTQKPEVVLDMTSSYTLPGGNALIRQISQELSEVVAIGCSGVHRVALLYRHIVEELFNPDLHRESPSTHPLFGSL
jgi:hypothetical protein